MKHLEEIKLGIRILMLDDVFAGSQWLKITHNVSLDLSKNIFQCKKKNILKSHNKLVTKMKRYFLVIFKYCAGLITWDSAKSESLAMVRKLLVGDACANIFFSVGLASKGSLSSNSRSSYNSKRPWYGRKASKQFHTLSGSTCKQGFNRPKTFWGMQKLISI